MSYVRTTSCRLVPRWSRLRSGPAHHATPAAAWSEVPRPARPVAYLCLGIILALALQRSAAAAPDPRELLIVAPERFFAELRPYARFKQQQLPTTLSSLEAILRSSPGVDDPEKLKHYLYARWKTHHLGYVLLVGDADTLPVRYMVLDRVTPAAFDTAFYPSDLYYADLGREDGTFDDWNGRKDSFHAGYFGEVHGEKNKKDPINFDGIHYHCDVAVGRWPVSAPAEVQLVAAKSIAYETGLAHRTKPGSATAALFSVGGWVDSRPLMYHLGSQLARHWAVEKRLYSDSHSTDPAPDESQLDALLNRGVGLVCHAGHGSDDSWWKCFERGHLDRVHNADRLPVMISCGCSTARFATLPPYEPYTDVFGKDHSGSDHGEVFTAPPPPPAPYQFGAHNPTGLGEQLLRAGPSGAVAYIGCNTGGQPCGLTLLEGFVQGITEAEQAGAAPRLGDCWNRAISWYWNHEHLSALIPNDDWYPPSIFFQGMKFMVFGDPTLPLP